MHNDNVSPTQNQVLLTNADEIVTSGIPDNVSDRMLENVIAYVNRVWFKFAPPMIKLDAAISELEAQLAELKACRTALYDMYTNTWIAGDMAETELERRAQAAAAGGKREAGE